MGEDLQDWKDYRKWNGMLGVKLESLGYGRGLALAFLVGFVIRLVHELLSFPYPIGWDTIYYASRTHSGIVFTVESDLVNSWFVYGILIGLGNLTRLEPFVSAFLTLKKATNTGNVGLTQ